MGRKKKEEIVEEIENLEEQVTEETEVQEEALAEGPEEGSENAEVVAVEEEKVEEPKPKRRRSPRKKVADTPEAQIEMATEAMKNTMEEMVKHWSTLQSITGQVSSQLEKVSHIVKPSIQDFVNTNDSLVRPKADNSQFAMRFTAAASIVAVLFSLVSMSLSQSARTVALNAEASRVASSQSVTRDSEIAYQRPTIPKASNGKLKKF